ncbi:MAG: hypothetical protein AUI45_01480 [Acidobacteria bacterium 13_1_40CM_2_56_11]|nr:MAG: hypothetical protein AUI45_01480 [Acidobacteria bacterium 13_1_40CM_2_56_11]
MKGSGDKTVIVLSGRLVAVSTRKTLRIVTESGAFELSEDVSSRVAESIRAKIRANFAGSNGASDS